MDNTINEIQNLCFFRQKIIDVDHQEEIVEYELLLRLEKESNYSFPEELFSKLMINRVYHKLYIRHINNILYNHLKKNNEIYSLNIDYQELYYPETIIFLKNFEYKNRLKIELTERVPFTRDTDYVEALPIQVIKEIADMGYQIVLDDFLSGINSFETLYKIEASISRVKISTLLFKKYLSMSELGAFILTIVSSIASLEKEIVVEGVEDQELLNLFPSEWKLQTYMYDVPHKF